MKEHAKHIGAPTSLGQRLKTEKAEQKQFSSR